MNISAEGKQWRVLPIAALTCLALLLDLYSLNSKSLWGDEGFTLFMARISLRDFWHIAHRGEGNMVLYYALLRLWLHFGHSEFLVRAFSALWAVLTVPVAMALARRLFGGKAAILSGLLLALHPAEVYYAQEARAYSFAVFMAALSSWCFLRLLERKNSASWVLYGLISVLAVYVHLFTIFVLFAQWISLLFLKAQPLSRRFLLLYAMVFAVLIAPMALFVSRTYKAQVPWVSKTSPDGFIALLQLLTLPKVGVLLYLAGWMAAAYAYYLHRRDHGWPYLFAAGWLVVPILLTVIVSVHKPMLAPRFLLVCLPASVLLASAGFARLPRPYAVGAALLVALLSARSLASYYRNDKIKEDWRGATRYVLSHSGPDDVVVVLPSYGRYTFDYYRDLSAGEAAGLREADSIDSATMLPAPRIWLVRFLGSDSISREAILHQLDYQSRGRYQLAQEQEFHGIEVLEVRSGRSP